MFTKVKEIIRKIRIKLIHLRVNMHAEQLQVFSKSIIIAPHPDDEVIGCAGLIQRSLKEGKEVYVAILTGGEGSHNGCCQIAPQELIDMRRGLASKINKELGIASENLFFLDYPDGSIKYEYRETDRLNQLIKQIHPDSILLPHTGEGWNDHIQAGNIVKRLTIGNTDIQLYEYCVWFWYYNTWKIDWNNAQLLSMTKDEHLKKNDAINEYIYPKAPCGKPWSGTLPETFIKANRWNKELYFRIK